MELKDLREWLQFFFVATGGVIAAIAYFQNLRQRRVENALKFIALFRDGLEKDDLLEWKKLLRASSESAGAKAGQYFNERRNEHASIGDYFSEGSEDGQAISRMVQSLDVVCHQVMTKAADARTIFYELGQLLRFFNYQLSAFESPVSDETFLQYCAPNIHQFFISYQKQTEKWPSRIYAYLE